MWLRWRAAERTAVDGGDVNRNCLSVVLVAALMLAGSSVVDGAGPSIRMVSPPHLRSEVRSTVVLHCAYNSSRPAAVTWMHNGSTLASSHFSVRTSEVHTELTLQNVQWKDGGVYACSVNSVFGRSAAVTRLQVTGNAAGTGGADRDPNSIYIEEPELYVGSVIKDNPDGANSPGWRRKVKRNGLNNAAEADAAERKTGPHETTWFIAVTCVAVMVSSVTILILCAARRRRKAQRMVQAANEAKAEKDEEDVKEETPPLSDVDSLSKLAVQSTAELKAKKHGFDYSKPMTVQTLSCSPTHSREPSVRAAKSETTIPQLLAQKDSTSPSPTDPRQSDVLALTASLSDVAALSRVAAQRSRYHRKQESPDSDSAQTQRPSSVSALQSLPDSSTNLTGESAPTKQSTRIKLSFSELTKGALKGIRKSSQDASKSNRINEPVKRPRSKTISSASSNARQRQDDLQNGVDTPKAPSPQERVSPIAVDSIDEEVQEIDSNSRGRLSGALKMSKSLECLDSRGSDGPLSMAPRSGTLTPPPSGCVPLALLRPKPRPRASTNVTRAKKPRVVVEARTVSPTSWDYSNGEPPALPFIQNAAAGISTPPTTLSRKREQHNDAVRAPSAPPPALPSSMPPPLVDKKPLPMPAPRKSRKNIHLGGAREVNSGGLEKITSPSEDAEKDVCDAYEKVDLALLTPQDSNVMAKTSAQRTLSAPKPRHIYDRPEGRDQRNNGGGTPSRPDLASSYAVSGPLDDRTLPPIPQPKQADKSTAQRRSLGEVQIAELDDILQTIELTSKDLGKLTERSSSIDGSPGQFQAIPIHLYDQPEHTEKPKCRDRSMSLNQRPSRNTHDPLVQYMSVEFLKKEKEAAAVEAAKPAGPTVYSVVDPRATNADPALKAPPRPKSPVEDYEPVEAPRLVPHSFKGHKPRELFQAQLNQQQQQQQQKRSRKQLFQKSLKW